MKSKVGGQIVSEFMILYGLVQKNLKDFTQKLKDFAQKLKQKMLKNSMVRWFLTLPSTRNRHKKSLIYLLF